MTIRDLSDAAEGLGSTNYEYCIIGGGMAGLFIARRLAEAGRRVAVLESGRLGFDQQIHELNTIVDSYGYYSRALDGRYRGLGGSSSRWGGRLVPIYGHETAKRDHLGLEGWPLDYRELQPYGREIEAAFGLPPGSFGKEALERSKLHADFPTDDPDFTARFAKWINYRQCNLGQLWRRALEKLQGLDIWLGATVTNFVYDTAQGRLDGVQASDFSGNRISVNAGHFIVAAGTIETTRLLLWLDAQTAGRAFGKTQALGHYFQDHLKAEAATIARNDVAESNRLFGYHYIDGARRSLHIDLTQSAQEADGSTSAFAYAAMDLSNSPLVRIKALVRAMQAGQLKLSDAIALVDQLPLLLNVAFWRLVRKQVYMPENVRLGLQIAIEQRPNWDNYIKLSAERDRLGTPRAELWWQPKVEDELTFRATAKRLKNYWERSSFGQGSPLSWLVGEDRDDSRFIDVASAYAHPSGSTRMGTDPTSSVVRPDLTCHGVPNLSVASASVFPSAGSANPTYTILQLALWHADKLLKVKKVAAATIEPAPYTASETRTMASASLNTSATRATSSSSI
ncbi:FAD-dependent oxidoreductase [Devosia naphthalenivorans]|uniref:FAD-dependent oxidoreductase n=1 Tax=Devosia naphthalenivorans TaxID=2082392 RepID=UPI000D367C04|nr:GMC family oxidoreductase [Devosia naphthalenivorans]